MTDTKIILDIHGKRAEMTLAEAREMLRQLKVVFGETALPVGSPAGQPSALPWEPTVWCGTGIRETFGTLSGHNEYDWLVRN